MQICIFFCPLAEKRPIQCEIEMYDNKMKQIRTENKN